MNADFCLIFLIGGTNGLKVSMRFKEIFWQKIIIGLVVTYYQECNFFTEEKFKNYVQTLQVSARKQNSDIYQIFDQI